MNHWYVKWLAQLHSDTNSVIHLSTELRSISEEPGTPDTELHAAATVHKRSREPSLFHRWVPLGVPGVALDVPPAALAAGFPSSTQFRRRVQRSVDNAGPTCRYHTEVQQTDETHGRAFFQATCPDSTSYAGPRPRPRLAQSHPT